MIAPGEGIGLAAGSGFGCRHRRHLRHGAIEAASVRPNGGFTGFDRHYRSEKLQRTVQ